MKLDWKERGRAGNIKRLENPFEISIHKYVGCGDALFLSCPTLRISQLNLNTEDWDVAEENAIKAVQRTVCNIHSDMMNMVWECEFGK